MPTSPRRFHFLHHALGLGAVLLARGCTHDWSAYDPSGSGGASSSSSSSAGSTSSSAGSTSSSTGAASSSSGQPLGGAGGTGGAGGAASSSSSAASSSSSGTFCTPNISQPCYTGPPGTDANPPCAKGIQVCASDGSAFGPCLTEVTPASEDCGTAADDDCNGMVNDGCGLWSKRFGGSGDQKPRALAVAPGGDLYVTGELWGSPSLGGGNITTAGGGDLFVARYTSAGAHVWSRAFGDASFQSGYAIARDTTGNVYVAGSFVGTIAFGAGISITSAGLEDMFVVKLDSAGAPVWAKRFGDPGVQVANAIAVGPGGHVFIAGEFEGTVDFGSGPKIANGTDGVLIELDGAGAYIRSTVFGGAGTDTAQAVAVASNGDVVLGGVFAATATFGATTLTDQGSSDAFIARFATGGTLQWAKAYGSPDYEVITSVAFDSVGQIALTGLFAGPLDLGCGVIPAQGPTDILVAKLSPTGACVWSHGYGDPAGLQQSPRVAVDTADNVLLTGEYVGTMSFGGYPLVTSVASSHDILAVKLGAAGNHVWSRRFGDDGDQDGRGIGADGTGNVYIVGEITGSVDFGNGVLTSGGGDDMVMVKLAP